MSKASSFAQGFASTFVPAYTARVAAEQKKETDKIKMGAQLFLSEYEDYKAQEAASKSAYAKANSLFETEQGIKKEYIPTIAKMFEQGRTVDSILKDLRTKGSKWELEGTPEVETSAMESPAVAAPDSVGTSEIETSTLPPPASVEAQTDSILGESTDAMLDQAFEGGEEASKPVDTRQELFVENTKETPTVENTKQTPKKDNLFNKYRTEISEMVGQDVDFYDKVLAGYKAPETEGPKYRFVPGVTKVSVNSLDDAYAASVQNSQEYIDAVNTGNVPLQQEILVAAMQDKTNGSKNQFGTGSTAVVMGVWAETPDGKAALASGDPMAIAKQINIFESIISPDKTNKKAFDLDNLDASFLAIWENSPEGIKAIADGDTNAINLAIAASAEQGNIARNSINAGYGFKPEDVTELKQVPGLLEKYKNYPVVMDQIVSIRDSLRAQETESQTAVPKRVYGVGPDGETMFVGTGNYKGGRLYMPDPENPEKEVAVPIATAAQYQLTDTDQPIDVLKWNINEITKKKNTLTGTVDFASDALTYISGLQNNPLARTRVARLTSGASELLDELQAIKEISSIVNPDGSGEMLIDQDRMLREIQNNVSLNKFSSGVRSVIAQETSLIFSVARAEGNSGQALSNKDYDNYFKSIFNSNDPRVIEQNILRKVGSSYNSALVGAKSVGSMQGMEFVTEGNGGRWWSNPEEFAVDGRANPVKNFLNQAVKTVSDIQESSTYKTTAKQLLDIYQSGGSITVTEELANTYPSLRGKAGQTIQKTPKGANNGE